MRRRRFRKPVTSVSLFPFIAVLICTMGALIVLLVLVVQQARVQAHTITAERKGQEQHVQQDRQKLLQDQEDLDWQREILQQQRAELNKLMAEERLRLSHLEEHVRRLENRLQRLQAEAEELDRLQHEDAEQGLAHRQEIENLRTQIQREQAALDAARDEAARRQRSFAIIPYRGPNGTQRRPIYIECRESEIVLQPEGIVLKPEDFSGPLGPGNPLDAALRTIREHWQRVEGEAAKGEPYPLLIVRPDGALAYSMARAAMAAWDDEFGYELVSEELELAFPPADPTLGRLLAGTIQTARQRQALLAAAMPSRFERPNTSSYAGPDRQASGQPDDGSMPRGSGAGAGGWGDQLGPSEPRSRPLPGEQENAAEAADGPEPAGAEDGSCPFGENAGDGASAPGGAALQSMANRNGQDWALPEDVSGLTAITRPIVVDCYPDRLVIRADQGDQRSPQVIPCEGPTHACIDQLVTGLQAHMKRWGMAVAGGYWKPVARVQVFPGAETRFRELQILLDNSGIQVERR
jgi:hypothetical protein